MKNRLPKPKNETPQRQSEERTYRRRRNVGRAVATLVPTLVGGGLFVNSMRDNPSNAADKMDTTTTLSYDIGSKTKVTDTLTIPVDTQPGGENVVVSTSLVPPSNTQPEISTNTSPAPSSSEPAPTTEVPSVGSYEIIQTGLVNMAELDPGPNPLVIEWNNQEILVPRLDDVTPERAALTAMANISAYFTTGDERILDNFAGAYPDTDLGTDENARQNIMDNRIAFFDTHPELANNPNVQFVFFDKADNPAEFTVSPNTGEGFVLLYENSLFLGVSTEPAEYQSLDKIEMSFPMALEFRVDNVIYFDDPTVSRVDNLWFGVLPNSSGEVFIA